MNTTPNTTFDTITKFLFIEKTSTFSWWGLNITPNTTFDTKCKHHKESFFLLKELQLFHLWGFFMLLTQIAFCDNSTWSLLLLCIQWWCSFGIRVHLSPELRHASIHTRYVGLEKGRERDLLYLGKWHLSGYIYLFVFENLNAMVCSQLTLSNLRASVCF